MFWFVFEWVSDPDHFIFLGLLYLALIIIGVALHVAGIKTLLQYLGFMRERHFDH